MVAYILLKIFEGLVRIIPLSIMMRIGRFLGASVFYLDKRHRKVALRNLQFAFPEKNFKEKFKIARGAFQNLVLVAIEMIILSRMRPEELKGKVTLIGEENLKNADKHKILFLTGHVGNWEILACFGGTIHMLSSVVARKIKNPWIDRWVNRIRENYHVRIIEKGAVRKMLDTFKKEEHIGTLVDQDGGIRGQFAPYFNRLASTPTGLIRMALNHQRAIIPVFVRRESDRLDFSVVLWPDLNISMSGETKEDQLNRIVSQYTHQLEAFIREKPDQWLWLHRRWKTLPPDLTHEPSTVWILDDGKKGHLNQIQGLIHPNQDHKLIKIAYRSSIHRAVIFLSAFLRISSYQLLEWALKEKIPSNISPPKLILACGSTCVPASYILKECYYAQSVIVMKSGFPCPHKYFDLVLLPKHDQRKKELNSINLLLGTSCISQEKINHQKEILINTLNISGEQIIGILVGGSSSRVQMSETYLKRLKEVCQNLSQQYQVIVVASRRSPKIISELFSNIEGIHLMGLETLPFEPVAAIFGICEWICVTEDSYSMISEAIYARKKVLTLAVPKKKPLKYETTLQELNEKKIIIRSNLEDIHNHINQSMNWQPQIEPLLKEYDEIVRKIQKMIETYR